jgi:predicted Zn-dependent peptidase
MKYFVNRIVFYILLLFLFATNPIFTQETELDFVTSNKPFELYRFTLDNGLRVWCQPRSDSKSVIAFMVIRAGSRYENSSNNGVSHYVEHMVFTGTERWDEKEIKDIISKRGGRWNGWTSEEKTIYYAEVPARDFGILMDWISEIVFHPTFPEEKIDKERKVIFQENWGKYGWIVNTLIKLGFGYELRRSIESAIFPDSTLSFRILGEDKSLENIDREVLVDYYQNYYMPNNATLIVVGNVTQQQVLEKSEMYFGDIKKKKAPDLPKTPELPNDGPHKAIVRGPLATDQCELRIGARTVGLKHPDRWPLEVLREVLYKSLIKEIRYKRGLVYSLGAYNRLYTDAGYFVVYTYSEKADRDLIQKIIEEYLEKIRRGDIDPEKVSEAKTALKGRWALSMETNYRRAAWLEDWTFVLAADEPVPDYESMIDLVTPEDLSRVLKTYFTPKQSFVGMHLPVVTVKSGVRAFVIIILLVFAGLIIYKIRRKKKKKSTPIPQK